MSRSVKKGPYVHPSLQKKIEALNAASDKKVVKTWSRSSTILPDFLDANMYQCSLRKIW